jgi:hypothetical protein
MSIFKEFAEKIDKIDIDSILQNIMNYDFTKEFVINTIQERIENTGIDAKNQKMQTNKSSSGAYGAYSKFTENLKAKSGDQFKHVTLKDKGDFYNSFNILANKQWIEISATFQKDDGNIYENLSGMYSGEIDFESAILNMNEKEFEIFVKKIILPEFLGILNYEITK